MYAAGLVLAAVSWYFESARAQQTEFDIDENIDGKQGFLFPESLVSDTDSLAGHTTYRLIAKTKIPYITSIYALYGDKANPMTLPAAYHVDAPFGVDIGGVNPAFFSINPDVQYDSWLTVGITGGNVHNSISSIGIDWESWTETSRCFTDDGAVFWMDPTVGPKFADAAVCECATGTGSKCDECQAFFDGGIILGQLTIPDHGVSAVPWVIMNAQGGCDSKLSPDGKGGWEETHIMFKLSSSAGAPAPAPALAPTSATPPPPASPNLDPNTGLPITSTPGLAWVQPPPAPVPAEYPGSGPVCPAGTFLMKGLGSSGAGVTCQPCPRYSTSARGSESADDCKPPGRKATGATDGAPGDGEGQCMCQHRWRFQGSTYHDCDTITDRLAGGSYKMCYVQAGCNAQASPGWGASEDGTVWIECDASNVAPPSPVEAPAVHPCTAVQHKMLVNCLANLDDCSVHLASYSTVVGDCTDEGDCTEPCELAKDRMRDAVEAYTDRPPPPPPPSCDIDVLQSSFQAVEDACCVGDQCDSGIPRVCGPTCKDVVLDFHDKCRAVLDSMQGSFSSFEEFVKVCETPPPPPPPTSAPAGTPTAVRNAANPNLGAVLAGPAANAPALSCDYPELMAVVLECSSASVQETLSPAFCATRCAGKLLPFVRQCTESMGSALASFGLADTAQQLADNCAAPGAAPSACPMRTISKACDSFDAAATDPCQSTCQQLIRQHYDACGASADAMVQAAFASWAPLVALCQGQSDAGSAREEIVAQCAAAQTNILGQLSAACCTDSLCAAMPKTCPRVCSSLLMPFYHDCAQQMMAQNPELLARLTSLASICADGSGGGH